MFSIEITRIVTESNSVKTFFFKSQTPITYKAGQFITLLHNDGFKELRRNYSFSSAPSETGIYSISLKRIPNGAFSRWMFDHVQVGDTIQAIGPSGMFTIPHLNDDKKSQLMLVAAGSGIVPVFSIIKQTIATRPDLRITLFYSNSSPETTVFLHQLKKLEASHPTQLHIEWLFSNNHNLMRARLSKLVLKDLIAAHRLSEWKNVYVYTCGPFEYMRMVNIVFVNEGLPPLHFRMEQFLDIDPPKVEKRFYDKQDRMISVSYRERTYNILVPWNLSILDAALKAGINLPYSCHAGRCSTCRCKILSGSIWMHYNQILTDADEAEGWALTCTGHPSSDDLHIMVS